MKREDALQFRKVLEAAADNFTDEKILQVPAFVEKWAAGISYAAGKRLEYNGTIYKVLQEHVSQETWTPETAAALYAKLLITDPDVIPEWEQPDSTNAYMTGDRVMHNGITWKSLVDNNVWEPGATGSEELWETV